MIVAQIAQIKQNQQKGECKMLSFSDILLKLQDFWKNEGCLLLQPYDIPAGAGTFHPATLLRIENEGNLPTRYY